MGHKFLELIKFKAFIFLIGFLAFTIVPTLSLIFDQEVMSVVVIEEENYKNKLDFKDYSHSENDVVFKYYDFLDTDKQCFKYNCTFVSVYIDTAYPPPKFS